jgi:hypothetical protein
VRLVTSDAHEGLKQAIATVLSGATWQRCRVHFMRNPMTQLRKVADGLRGRFAQAAALLEDAAEDILAYRHLPLEHQRQLHSTNPLERLNKEIKRRSNVVGIFPTPQSVIRLVGAILLEQDDEWAVAERRYFSAESMKQLTAPTLPATAQEIFAAIAGGEGKESVWALVENLLCGFPSSGGRCSFRPQLRQRPRRGRTQGRRARITPLDGTLPLRGAHALAQQQRLCEGSHGRRANRVDSQEASARPLTITGNSP